MNLSNPPYSVRLADNQDDINAAQKLRYRVFVDEFGAKPSSFDADEIERDRFDPFFDHIILTETATDKIVGYTRILTRDAALANCGFYGASEYDLTVFEKSSRSSAELGRSCIAPEHRNGIGLHILWQGLADYVHTHQIEILFGVASFMGTDPSVYAHALSHLHHSYLAPKSLRPIAKDKANISMNQLRTDQVNRVLAMQQMPNLIKGYLRLGGQVGMDAFIDHGFNTVDVCMIMDTKQLSEKYRQIYAKG